MAQSRPRRRKPAGKPIRRAGQILAGLLGLGFGYAAWIYLTLPDVRVLRTTNPETTAFIQLRVREAQSKGAPLRVDQRWVSYGRISQNLTRAVLVAEDGKFWQHDGLDYEQLKESIEVNLERMEFARGGSTITQQLAKNLYLWPTKDPTRKLRELLIARRLEVELPKQRILELYLNVVEWGDGIFGAEAAARVYFHRSAAELSAPEAALLAGALVNARLLDPAHPTARLRRRQQLVLRRMGAVTPPPAIGPSDSPPPTVPEAPTAPADLPGQPVGLPTVPPPAPPGGRGPGLNP